MKKLITFLVLVLIFTSCADVSPNVADCVTNDAYGFWGGLWHGMIATFAFIGSLFSDDIAVYAYNNTGAFYDLGFVLGIGSLFGGASSAAK